MAVKDIVNRYQSKSDAHPNDTATHQDFQQVVQSAPPDAVANGIAGMFKSNETPPFADLISNLFGQSNPDQKAGLLSHLLSVVPSSAVAGLPGLGGLLGADRQTAESAASQLSPEQVRQLAANAEARDSGIIEKVSGFYARHPGLMKAVGGVALTVAMKHMAKRAA